MFNYKIVNKNQIDNFIRQSVNCGHEVVALSGPAPESACYSDGELVNREVNIAWQNQVTGERVDIIYERTS